MMFFASLADLGRAIQQGRLRSDDQVYVPRKALDAAGEEARSRLDGTLRDAGAQLHVSTTIPRICVVTLEELRSGHGPPFATAPPHWPDDAAPR
jgi:hypothetical protein